VYQFARDAAVAEAWLIAQEPYLMSQELGVSYPFCSILNYAKTLLKSQMLFSVICRIMAQDTFL
jgi:hypothetical protein